MSDIDYVKPYMKENGEFMAAVAKNAGEGGMTTLRRAVMGLVRNYETGFDDPADTANAIADILEATGAPAYIRVAKDLRGEWVEGEEEGDGR